MFRRSLTDIQRRDDDIRLPLPGVGDFQEAQLQEADGVLFNGIQFGASVARRQPTGATINGTKFLVANIKKERLERELVIAQQNLEKAKAELQVAEQKLTISLAELRACQGSSEE